MTPRPAGRPTHRPPRALVGTSGWSYEGWRAGLYAGVPRARWLAHYASLFDSVEVNASFYHSLAPSTYAAWREQTPPGFRFAVKGSRYVTHVRKLHDPAEPVARQRAAASRLGDKLFAVLWQLPAGLHRHDDLLAGFVAALAAWRGPRHAIEFRHASWFAPEVAELLARGRVASVISDAADWPRWDEVTTDLAYVRLHGHDATYWSAYSDAALAGWAARIRRWLAEGRDVAVYFDNTDAGHAPRDAARLAAMLRGPGARRRSAPSPSSPAAAARSRSSRSRP
ncbi:MAG: DUF72 domain-containing protein [Burkholderiales bacterium]|nr:DUF72 domain-containing protein [Burkholderiales bacterium]